MTDSFTKKELEKMKEFNVMDNLDKIKIEKNIIEEELNIKISFLANGGESNIYEFLDEYGNKKIIKIYSANRMLANSDDILGNLFKVQENIKDTKKSLKPIDNGVFIIDNKDVPYQIYESVGQDLYDAYGYIKNFDETFMIIFRITIAICSLHNKNIAHRDIKLENVLYDRHNTKVKIIDFNSSERIEDNNKVNFTKNLITPNYLSPELMKECIACSKLPNSKKENYTIKNEYLLPTDIYALGILFYVMLTKNDRIIFSNDLKNKSLFRNRLIVANDERTKVSLKSNGVPEKISGNLIKLISSMIAIDPIKRPSAKDILTILFEFYKELELEKKLIYKLSPGEKIFIEENVPNANINIRLNDFQEIISDISKGIDSIPCTCNKNNINKKLRKKFIPEANIDDVPEHLQGEERVRYKKLKKQIKKLKQLLDVYFKDKNPEDGNSLFLKNLNSILDFSRKDRKFISII